jgi:sugar phosphate isomerase/epimerase
VKLSLSEISTVDAAFAEDVVAYAAAGLDGIGIWEFKLSQDDDENTRLLERYGLGVSNCIPAIPSILQLAIPGMEGPPDPAERIEALCASMHRLSRYAPASVLCLTGPVRDRDPEQAYEIVVDGMRQIAAAARSAGVRLGLEPTHASESHESSFLSTIGEAIELLDEAGLDDVGVMVDSVHVWDTPSLEDDIARHGARITGLHVADKFDPGAAGRLLPGEGMTRPDRVLDLVLATGFDGYIDVEIFSTPEAFWGLPPDEAARRAHHALTRLTSRSMTPRSESP